MTDMDSGRPDDGILKRDARGRVRTSVRQREAILDEFERSGLSGPKFSQVAGVCYQTFAGWMLKRRRARGDHDLSPVKVAARRVEPGAALLRWVEAETGLSGGTGGVGAKREPDTGGGAVRVLTVRMAGGVVVELDHEAQLSLVVELARRLNVHFAKPC